MFYIALAVGCNCDRKDSVRIAKSIVTLRRADPEVIRQFFKTLTFFIFTNNEDMGQ